LATTTFQWVKGYQGNLGNEECDKLAKEGVNKNKTDQLSLNIPREYDLQGAKLAAPTQATAYKGIQEQSTPPPHTATNRTLETIRQAVMTYQGSLEMDSAIWESIRKCTIHTRVQQFLFKTIHNTLMVGDVWSHIPNFEQRGRCETCNTTESMEHILIGCTAGAAIKIWTLAEELWPYELPQWPDINLGVMIGCRTLIGPPPEEIARRPGEPPQVPMGRRGANRLLQILISESTHLIWVLRCERVIQERPHNDREAEARWFKAIN